MIDWKKIGEYAYKQADMGAPTKYGLATAAGGAAIVPFLYWLMANKEKFSARRAIASSLIGAMAGGALGTGAGMLKEHVIDNLDKVTNDLSNTSNTLNTQLQGFQKTNDNIADITAAGKEIADKLKAVDPKDLAKSVGTAALSQLMGGRHNKNKEEQKL